MDFTTEEEALVLAALVIASAQLEECESTDSTQQAADMVKLASRFFQ